MYCVGIGFRIGINSCPVSDAASDSMSKVQSFVLTQVSIFLPPVKTVRCVVEKMKNLCNHVSVSANQSGEMSLRLENDLVTIVTHFRDLENPSWCK